MLQGQALPDQLEAAGMSHLYKNTEALRRYRPYTITEP